ncbi:ankyrin repeat domain-containing protein [Candidatus Micrarchaeota archaeon]|nr:ankyrin repeat domain-containing protein [Candidatus Micrarchaeota archaeon]
MRKKARKGKTKGFQDKNVVNKRLFEAVRTKNIEELKRLVKGADIDSRDERDNTLLIMAARGENNREILEFLIEKGADLKAVNYRGRNALHVAARAGRLQNARVLIEHGADKNICDSDGMTALKLAEGYDNKEVADFLKEE